MLPVSPLLASVREDKKPPGPACPLRVLFVIPGDGQGSSMIFTRRQAKSLIAEGVDVECFYLRSRTSPATLLAEFLRFRSVRARLKPAVVHAHFGTITALFAAFGCGLGPLMITFRGTDLNPAPSGGARAAAGRVVSQFAALRASSIVCVSRQLRSRLWWRKHRVIVIPSGVDSAQFRPLDRAEARRRLGWPLQDRVVLFNSGHDARNKRLDLAEAAFALARLTLPDLRLEILRGDTDPESIPLRMNASDCLLVASDSEGSPTVVQEALACGLPIVSVPVGDIEERLRQVSHTRIVPRDAACLAQAIVELTQAPLRTNGRSKINEISLEFIAGQLKNLYETVARS
jgi:teichuronic acid biosynthesis glycosyltransferase TuaC